MKKVGVKVLQRDEWQIEENLVLKKEKIYMLKDKALRIEIIQLYYNVLVVGQRERQKIIEIVMRDYWQLGVTKDIKKYVNGCNMC